MSVAKFIAWLTSAAPGDRFAYHKGLLMLDRQRSPQRSNALQVGAMGRETMRAYQLGYVFLVQQRDGSGCIYYAIKRAE